MAAIKGFEKEYTRKTKGIGKEFLICNLMRIGFDAKRAFHNATGLGNYSRRLLSSYSLVFPENQLYLYHFRENQQFWKTSLGGNLHERFPSGKWKIFPSLWRSGGIIQDLQRDGIKLFHGLSNEIPLGLEKSKIKSVLSIHDLIFIRYPELYNTIDRRIYLRKITASANQADLILACSQQTANDIEEFLKIDSSKIKVLYQDCEPAFRVEKKEGLSHFLESHYSLKGEYMLCVGTLEKRKNQLNLLKAFHQALIPDLKLVFVGKKGDLFQELQSYTQINKLTDRVVFLEKVPSKDLPLLYQGARAFAYVSRFEGFGIPILEALRSGVPVLTVNTSSLVEVAGAAAVYCKPDSVDEMASALTRLVFDETTRKELIQKGLEQAQMFNAESLSEQLNNYYSLLIQ